MSPPAKKQKFQNKKKYYQPNRKQYLEVGSRGFLATCNFNEKGCVRECYNILNEYADVLYGPEVEEAKSTEENSLNEKEAVTTAESTDNNEEDISDVLQKQIDTTEEKRKSRAKNRFQAVDTGATNCVFIKTTLDDPVGLAKEIVNSIANLKEQKTKNLLRLVPIESVCKANAKDMLEAAGKLCDKYFLQEPCTFSIVFNKRFNNDVDKMSLTKELADIIHSKNIKHSVDLKYAKKSLIVEVIKGLCCLAVVEDYMKMKKYNLIEIARVNPEYEKINQAKPEEPAVQDNTADSKTTSETEAQE